MYFPFVWNICMVQVKASTGRKQETIAKNPAWSDRGGFTGQYSPNAVDASGNRVPRRCYLL